MADQLSAINHIVVLALENRSFDQMLAHRSFRSCEIIALVLRTTQYKTRTLFLLGDY